MHTANSPVSLRRRAFRVPGLMSWLVALFILLSATDLFLTWQLLADPSNFAYEANPVAAHLLRKGGWLGLGAFKAACLTVVLGVVTLLHRRRPEIGRRVLALGCGVLAAVVSYSVALPHLTLFDGEGESGLHAALERRNQLDQEFTKTKRFIQKTDELAEGLARKRLPLRQAVGQLESFLEEINFNPRPQLRYFLRMDDDRAILAAKLVRHVGFVLQDNPELPQQPLPELTQQFEEEFHRELPEFAQESYAPPVEEP